MSSLNGASSLADAGKYREIGSKIGAVVEQKQEAYGDSFSKAHLILEVLYPNGITPEQYPELLTIVRVIDKLFRIATDNDKLGESPWADICGYSILSIARKGIPAQDTPEANYQPSGSATAQHQLSKETLADFVKLAKYEYHS